MTYLPVSSVVADPTGAPPALLTVIFTSLTGTSSLGSAVPFLSMSVPRTDVLLPLDAVSLPEDEEAEDPESDEVVEVDGGCCAPAEGARSCSAAISPAITAATSSRRLAGPNLPPTMWGRTLEDGVAGCGLITGEERKCLRLSFRVVRMHDTEGQRFRQVLADLARREVHARDDVLADEVRLVDEGELRNRLPGSERA